MPSENGAQNPLLRPVRILSVPNGFPLSIRFLGPYLGLTTHWHSGRTHPCLGSERCIPTIHRSRTVWKAYAPVESWEIVTELWIPAVLEITESLESHLTGRRLRGETWILSRSASKKVGSVIGVYTETVPEKDLRPAFSIVSILERFYHQKDLQLGTPNPIPPQVFLNAQEGPGPAGLCDLIPPSPEALKPSPETLATFKQQLGEMKASFGSKGPNIPKPSNNGQSPNERKGGGK